MLYIGIDLGTSATKFLLMDEAGAILNLGVDIRWADSFARAADNSIYFTTSAINYPVEQQPPYELYRMIWKDQKEPQNPYN